MRILLLLISLMPSMAHGAKFCADRPFVLKGNIRAEVEQYDKFIRRLQGKKNPHAEVQAYLEKHGLPFTADIKKGGVKALKGWLEMDGISGDTEATIFVKKIAAPKGSNLSFDTAYVFAAATEKKPLATYTTPYNEFYPLGVEGDELIFEKSLHEICGEGDSIEVMLALKPDGSIRALDWKQESKSKEVAKCQAKKIYKNSDYASCMEYTDKKSKQKRIIVLEMPMT